MIISETSIFFGRLYIWKINFATSWVSIKAHHQDFQLISEICFIRFVFHLVFMPPGWIPITRFGNHLNSICKFSSQPRKAHLVAPYIEKCWYDLKPIVAPIQIISALFPFIKGKRELVRIAGAIILRWNCRSVFFQSSFSISSPSPSPAQWIKREKSLNCSWMSVTEELTEFSSQRFVSIHFIKSAGSDRHSPTTSYPASWNTVASEAQSPEDTPVRIIRFIK